MSDATVSCWQLLVQYGLDDEETILSIDSAATLAARLESLRRGKPSLVILKKQGGPDVLVGIGGKFSGVMVFPKEQLGASVFAIPATSCSSDVASFVSEGIETPFPAKCLMPPSEAIRIACYIVENGSLPTWVEWGRGWDRHSPETSEAESPSSADQDDASIPDRDIPF
jgi:hypothetical protein